MRPSSLLREPLVHFLVLGLLIFAVDNYMRPPADSRRTINVDMKVENTLVTLFKDGQGREPTPEEVDRLVKRWLLNEIYYREALALGLDQGDEMIRSRLVLKMRDVLLSNLVVDPVSDDKLRAWFEANRKRYDTPERFDVMQFLVADGKSGSRQQAEKLLPVSSGGGAIPKAYANAVRRYTGRTRENIANLFGDSFASELLARRDAGWRVIESRRGWHVARVEAVHPAIPADFQDVRRQVKADYEEAQRTIAAFEAIKEIRSRYTILYNGKRILAELTGTDGGKPKAPAPVDGRKPDAKAEAGQ
jgi:PPIC-type PPIASE domain